MGYRTAVGAALALLVIAVAAACNSGEALYDEGFVYADAQCRETIQWEIRYNALRRNIGQDIDENRSASGRYWREWADLFEQDVRALGGAPDTPAATVLEADADWRADWLRRIGAALDAHGLGPRGEREIEALNDEVDEYNQRFALALPASASGAYRDWIGADVSADVLRVLQIMNQYRHQCGGIR